MKWRVFRLYIAGVGDDFFCFVLHLVFLSITMAGVVPVTGPLTVAQPMGAGVTENPHLISRRELIAARLARAATQPSIFNTQYRTVTYGSVVGPMAGLTMGTGEEILYPIGQGTGEQQRLGTDIFVKGIRFNGVLTTANGDPFDVNGAYARLILAYTEQKDVLVEFGGGGSTWRTERCFLNPAPSVQAALVTGATVKDDPRLCVLFDSGIKHIGGTANPATTELSFHVPGGFRAVYATSPVGTGADVLQGQLIAFIVGCMAGEDASVNASSTPRQVWWVGNVSIEFTNIQ